MPPKPWVNFALIGSALCACMALSGNAAVPLDPITTPSLPLAQTDLAPWAKIITDIGILSGLVFFFTWTNWKREERLASRITALENFTQNDLIACTKTCTETIVCNTKALSELVSALNHRPCLLETSLLREQIANFVYELRNSLTHPTARKEPDE